MAEGQAPSRTFPRKIAEFDQDDRIAFDKGKNQWILEDEDGTEWVFYEKVGAWTQSVDESALEEEKANWAPSADAAQANIPDEEQAFDVQRKRKHDDDEHGDDAEAKRVKLPAQRTAAKPAKANTAIYVTGLPKDTTVDELHEFFSKFGVIAESPEIKGIKQVTYDEEGDPVVNKIGPPRIKLYKNDDGSPKGDALIVFLDAQSVASAVDYGDESDFRAGTGKGSVIIRVDVADLSYKKTFDADEEGRKKLKEEATKTKKTYNSRLVVLDRMFTLFELKDDPNLHDEIIEDTQDHCDEVLGEGKAKKIIVYDGEPKGIVTIMFDSPESAQQCIKAFNGTRFADRVVTARLAESKEKFKKASNGDDENRLEEYLEYIEGGADEKRGTNGKDSEKIADSV